MICPECGCEYRDGIVECSDCNVPLTSEVLVEPEGENRVEPVFSEVVRTGNLGDIALIRSIFDAEGIVYHTLGENFNLTRPLLEQVRFFVREDFFEKSKELLNEAELNIFSLSTKTTSEDIDDE